MTIDEYLATSFRTGTGNIIQMDPVDRTTFAFVDGHLVRRDFASLELADGHSIPFGSKSLLTELDEE